MRSLKGTGYPFVTSCLLSLGENSFLLEKSLFSEGGRGAVLLGNFFPLRVEPFSEGGKQF